MTNDNIIEIAGKRLIRLSTFAQDMGLHIRTVQLWAKQHDMPVIRVGNQMLLDLDDIPVWLDRHKYEPTAFGAAKSVLSAQP
jgi:excisionase family DNA binding protein